MNGLGVPIEEPFRYERKQPSKVKDAHKHHSDTWKYDLFNGRELAKIRHLGRKIQKDEPNFTDFMDGME